MKRFVTYLYECERGNKGKNVGFIRVKVKERETTMELYIRNFLRSMDMGTIYAFIYKERLQKVQLGELQITNGQSDQFVEMSTDNIMESGYKLDQIQGIGIQMKSGAYIASCWKDAYEAEIISGELVGSKSIKEEVSELIPKPLEIMTQPEEVNLAVAEENILQDENSSEKTGPNQMVLYEKIDLSQIRDLPSPNWHLSTNSFLLHGFWNYGYLVLKKEMEGDEETLSLGIPGIFEKPEAVMAVLFGFPQFQEIPQEPQEQAKIEEKLELNPEPQVGAVGAWFTTLRK